MDNKNQEINDPTDNDFGCLGCLGCLIQILIAVLLSQGLFLRFAG